MIGHLWSAVRLRLGNRPDEEHRQIAIRIGIVSVAALYFFSDLFANAVTSVANVELARRGVTVVMGTTALLALWLLVQPGVSVVRRVIGMVHDVAAISAAMYLGGAGAAAVAAIYLWVTLGNGFRYGNGYLYACAALSFAGFSAVFWFSEYWRQQVTLSANILILLALIPPYVGGLLGSLHKAKDQLRVRASVDVLTGLPNRAEMEQHIDTVLDAQHDGHALLFCDLDHFKRVNDNAGHAAGDKLLADVARMITECIDEGDRAGRLGGDEFCVFLHECTMERARRVAESIRNTISGYRLAWGRDYFAVGISIGVAPSGAVKDMGSLFRLADAACYAAKNAGRDQVHVVDTRGGIADTQRIRNLFNSNAQATLESKVDECDPAASG